MFAFQTDISDSLIWEFVEMYLESLSVLNDLILEFNSCWGDKHRLKENFINLPVCAIFLNLYTIRQLLEA